MSTKFILNDENVEIFRNDDERLVNILKDTKCLAVKSPCYEGECGGCTILIDDEPCLACLTLLKEVEGKKVTTIEGFKKTKHFSVLSKSFEINGAVQCGYCTPGMIFAAYGLLKRNPHPSDDEIKEAISGNLCRCTGYVNIIKAIKLASLEDHIWHK